MYNIRMNVLVFKGSFNSISFSHLSQQGDGLMLDEIKGRELTRA